MYASQRSYHRNIALPGDSLPGGSGKGITGRRSHTRCHSLARGTLSGIARLRNDSAEDQRNCVIVHRWVVRSRISEPHRIRDTGILAVCSRWRSANAEVTASQRARLYKLSRRMGSIADANIGRPTACGSQREMSGRYLQFQPITPRDMLASRRRCAMALAFVHAGRLASHGPTDLLHDGRHRTNRG